MMQLDNVRKVFQQGAQQVEVLKGITLGVKAGEFVSVLGPSGSGKSTLLYVIGGLQRHTGGTIRLDGHDVTGMSDSQMTLFRRDHIGMVFQSYHLLPLLTAEENVALPALMAGKKLSAIEPKTRELLGLMGLSHRMAHKPAEMSGGEQQRVAIARALVLEPEIVLADEPTGALDSRNGEEVLKVLRSIATEMGRTVVMVTHDLSAAKVADRTVTLKDGVVVHDTQTRSVTG